MSRKVKQGRPRVWVIVGPTSSGKSALAVQLAKKLDGEVVSADSRQVYTGLDIGTGKITAREMKRVPHHLLNVASPKRVFTAQDFVRMGRAALDDILARNKTAIICGGTGFYIDALLGRVVLPAVAPNKKLRARLGKKSAAELFAVLKQMDPRRAREIDPQNPVRLIRAIEIATELGRVPKMPETHSRYPAHWIGLKPDDATLRKKIHVRLLSRLKAGMIAEAQRLHRAGVSFKRMEALGLEYRYLARFLQKKIDKESMVIELEKEIWRYARRQMTYWRKNTDIVWQ